MEYMKEFKITTSHNHSELAASYVDIGSVVEGFTGISGYNPYPLALENAKISMDLFVKKDFILENVSIKTETSNRDIPLELVTQNVINSNGVHYDIKFIMPAEDIIIRIESKRRDVIMETKKNDNGVVDYFEIPEDLAKELSELLTKQTIRERLLLQLIDEPDKYDKQEAMLIPVTAKIEAIKKKITKEFVPSKYASVNYSWNYDGWEVEKNRCQIIEN